MINKDATPAEKTSPKTELGQVDRWLFRDKESVEKRFGMELERVLQLRQSKEGQKALLEKMKQADPSLNGNATQVLSQVNTNIDQLQKKESFLMKIVKLPVRAVQAVGRTVKKHPVLTAVAGIAALLALLYSLPATGPTVGLYGRKLIDAFKNIIGKLRDAVATPEISTEAAGTVPVFGGAPSEAAVKAATEAYSPSSVQGVVDAAKNAGVLPEVTPGHMQKIQEAMSEINPIAPKKAPIDPFQAIGDLFDN